MKRRHRPGPPPWHEPRPVVLSAEYQREVDRSTEKLERQYRHAQKRAERAENRLAQARQRPQRSGRQRRHIRHLEAELELRRAELDEYQRMMQSTSASATNRGRASFRPVPPGDLGP